MSLGLKINDQPLELGREVCASTLDGATARRGGILSRIFDSQAGSHRIYEFDDCEFEGLAAGVHIYPCTHGYLDRDRRWNTQVRLFLKEKRLAKVVLKVLEGRTAAINFYERFAAAVTDSHGEPCREGRYHTCWQDGETRIEARLNPDLVNAEFEIAIAE